MNRIYRRILVVEFILIFFVPIIFLGAGFLIGIPIGVTTFLDGETEGIYLPMMTIGGVAGIWGAAQLLAKSLDDQMNIAKPKRLALYLAVGAASWIPAVIVAFESLGMFGLFSVLPYVMTLQLIATNRTHFGY